MESSKVGFSSVDAYMATCPEATQKKLAEVRATIKAAVPDAEETISYQIPTFTLQGRYLIHFAAYKSHIGLYPAPIGHAEFAEASLIYAAGKGTMKFPLDQPIPFDLIRKIVQFGAQGILEKTAAKSQKKKSSSKQPVESV